MVFELVITRNCNLNCKYCFEGDKKNSVMPMTLIPNIISFIDNYQTGSAINETIRIDFNGGEALLNKEFIKSFIAQTKSKKFQFSITTNGTLLDKEIIDLINDNDILIQVSLDGKKNTHDANRLFYTNEGSFDIVFSRLKEIQKKCKKELLNIGLVYTPETVKQLAENIRYLISEDFYSIATAACSDYKWKSEDYLEYERQLKEIGDLYIKCFENESYVEISDISGNIKNTCLGFTKRKCDAIIGELAILPDGNILPCGGFVGCKNETDFYVGDVYNGISENRKQEFIASEKSINLGFCKECKLFERCQNDCLALNNRINNDYHVIDETTCRINQISIIESDKVMNYLLNKKNKLFIDSYKDFFPKGVKYEI